MDSSFIERTLKASLAVTVLFWVVVAYYFSFSWSTGLVLGSLWSIGNLFLIKWVVQRVITVQERPWGPVAWALLIKFPLLYVAGYFILLQDHYPVAAPMLGFLLPFLVLVLKAAGRLMLGLHGPDAGRRRSHLVPKR